MRMVAISSLLVVGFVFAPLAATRADDWPYEALIDGFQPGDGQKVERKLHWGTSVLEGYRQALKENKPLVIVYLCAEGVDTCKHCKGFRKTLDSKLLGEFGDKAVFVVSRCHLFKDSRYDKFEDPVGGAIYKKLELRNTPTMTIIAPKTEVLEEIARLNGTFPAKELAKHFRTLLANEEPVE